MSKAVDRERHDSSSMGNDANITQFLTFTIGTQEYGLDIMTVREIKGWTESTRLPNSPPYMLGVINLRGIIIPIFDLRARFGKGDTQANPKNVIIILAISDRTIGILVDSVSDILSVFVSEIQDPPSSEVNGAEEFVNGLISLEKRMVVLLDLEKLFSEQLGELDLSESH